MSLEYFCTVHSEVVSDALGVSSPSALLVAA